MSSSDIPEGLQDVEDQVDTPRDDGSKLPAKEDVVKAMKEKILEMVPTFNKKKPIKPEEYFTDKYISSCFWVPRKEEFGGKPWLDDALFLFAHSRGFEYASAAKRFIMFNEAAYETKVVSLDEMAEDIATTLGDCGAYAMADGLDEQGRCVIYCTCSHFSWDKFTVMAAKRAHIWLFWQWAVMWGPVAQTKGISFVCCMKGMVMAQYCKEFEDWCDPIMLNAMPTKIAAMYMCYEPFWFGNIMWPLMKLGMKKKMVERVVWLGSKDEKVSARYLESAYKIPKGEPDIMNIKKTVPTELGGTYNLNPEVSHAYFRSKWKISDETVPEGCAPPVKKK